MKFIIPEINTPYKVLADITIELYYLDSVSLNKAIKRGLPTYDLPSFVLTAGSIFKIMLWNYRGNLCKIRILETADKRFEKLTGYVRLPGEDAPPFVQTVEFTV